MALKPLLDYVESTMHISPNPKYIFVSYSSKHLELSPTVTIGLSDSSKRKCLLALFFFPVGHKEERRKYISIKNLIINYI